MDNSRNAYTGNRFKTPDANKQYQSPYDMPSDELQDLNSRNQNPYTKYTINLTTAGQQKIDQPGQGLVFFGSDGSAIRIVNTTAFAWVQFNHSDPNIFDGGSATPNAVGGFPMKHARGFRGPFKNVFLNWPAQNGVWIDVIILLSKEVPWIDGESCT